MEKLVEHFKKVNKLRKDYALHQHSDDTLSATLWGNILSATVAEQSALFLSPAFHKARKETAKKLNQALLSSTSLTSDIGRWRRLSLKKKRNLMQRCAAIQASLQSSPGVKVKAAKVYNAKQSFNGVAEGELEDREGADDAITISKKALKGSFANALSTLVHEQTHIHQVWLARAFAKDALKPSHPLYQDAAFFFAEEKADAYILDTECEQAYYKQAVEVDAYGFEDLLKKEMSQSRKEWRKVFKDSAQATPKKPRLPRHHRRPSSSDPHMWI